MADELGSMTQKRSTSEKEQGQDMIHSSSSVRTIETLLRVTPMGLCTAALVVMLKNSQTNDYGDLSYSDLGAFKYLVYANAICFAYSLLSAFDTAVPRPLTLSRSWTMFFFDQVFTYLTLAAGTVSSEILYLAYNGDENVTWSKQCTVFDKFCSKATTSVGITFGAVACYVLLSLISSYRLFSSYAAPIPFLANKSTEIAVFPR
ncbi:CASP-like protein 2A1 [Carex rostrata]